MHLEAGSINLRYILNIHQVYNIEVAAFFCQLPLPGHKEVGSQCMCLNRSRSSQAFIETKSNIDVQKELTV